MFDVELVLMFPLIPAAIKALALPPLLVFWGFLLILTGGFLFEWACSQLEWFVFSGS